MTTYKFSPPNTSAMYVMRNRMHGLPHTDINWVARHTMAKDIPLNKQVLGRTFARLHSWACHGPDAVAAQWRGAYALFTKQHMGGEMSMRYSSRFTINAWL